MSASLPAGKGTFIWYAAATENGNLTQMVATAKAMGLSHVEIKDADGTNRSRACAAWKPEILGPMIDAFTDAGIAVWVWQYVYGLERNARVWGTDLQPEAAVQLQLLERFPKIAGVVMDGEAECKTSPNGARAYAHDLRSGTRKPIGLCSYRYPSYHPQFPWDILQYCDFHMPQVYWEGSHSPAKQLSQSINELNAKRRLPIIPVGSAYGAAPLGVTWNPTLDDLHRFDQAVRDNKLPGISWWYWSTIRRNPSWYAEICSHPWPLAPSQPVVAPPDTTQAYVVCAPRGAKLRRDPTTAVANVLSTMCANTKIRIDRIEQGWAHVVTVAGKPVSGWVCVVDPAGTTLVKPV